MPDDATTERVTVSRYDRRNAGQTGRYLVGPLANMDDSRAIRNRLQVIASQGPQNRIGLIPDPSDTRWEFDRTTEAFVVTEGPAPDMTDPARVIVDFPFPRSRPAPMHIHLAAPWLLLEFDHGLGGGRLISKLIAAITSDSPGYAEPRASTVCTRPGLRAFVHEVRENPVAMLHALSEMGRRPNRPVANGSFTESRQLVYARSDVHFLDKLRARRDTTSPTVTTLACVVSSALKSLESVGIRAEPYVGVLVDLNRHLPPEVEALSNFQGVAPIAVSPPFGAVPIATALAEYTSGCRTLVRFGLANGRDMLRSGISHDVQRCENRTATLTVSDHGESASRTIQWRSASDGLFLALAPLGSSNQISLVMGRVGSQLHLSASFFGSQFDRTLVESALSRVVDIADEVSAIGCCE